MKNMIMNIIENDPIIKQIYENDNSCFKNILVPRLIECDSDNILEVMLCMIASQSALYDALINNIAQFGDKELIKKCNDSIQKILSSEE